ncbi:MAG: DUF6515 family protein [Cyanobacteriota bacterium]
MIKNKMALTLMFCLLLCGGQNLKSYSVNNIFDNNPGKVLNVSTKLIALRRDGGFGRSSGGFGRSSGGFSRNYTSDFSSFKQNYPRSSGAGIMYSDSNIRSDRSNYNINRDDINRDNINRDKINRDNINRDNFNNDNININNKNNVVINSNNNYIHPVTPNYIPGHPDYNYYHYRNGSYWNGFYHGYYYNYPVAGVALGTFIGTLPLTVATIASSSGNNYYYDEGVYYQKVDNGYVVTQPSPGIEVTTIPDGFIPISYNGIDYYYYLGTFYIMDNTTSKYIVESPPAGIVVPYTPDGAQNIDINGNKLVKANDTYYLPKLEDNTMVFEVVNPDKL